MSTTLPTPVVSVRPVTVPAPSREGDLRLRVTAPTLGDRLPVLVFSHGYGLHGASMDTYRPLVDHWTEHGFVVVQPNHRDAEGGLADPELWRSRISDLSRTVDGVEEILAAVPGLVERVDLDRIAVAGHSYGATSASALAGARVVGEAWPDGPHPRVHAAVLLCLTGTGGADLSPFAAENFPFLNPDFSGLTVPSLVVAGAADDSQLSVRGPDWFTDGYRLAPGATDLLTLHGGEHSLGGIHGYHDTQTTDEDPGRVALVQRASTRYLRTALGLDDGAWPDLRASSAGDPAGRIDSKPVS